ncbi:hypothetical protein [Nevskia sp.]|uniref:hypothetical protein n=1 Tax=Nevskia sp. TaxID=1929292 RepID=UPI0025D881C3|nr:hypothetical protein [Nevskia sp.]
MQTSLQLEVASLSRDRGILNAAIGAEHASPGWSIAAFEFLRDYARRHVQFMAEDVIRLASVSDIPKPPDGRAFGSIIQRAVREGLIKKLGYAPAATSNLSPKCVWQSLIYVDQA